VLRASPDVTAKPVDYRQRLAAGQPKDRDEATRLTDEQTALRRVATLVYVVAEAFANTAKYAEASVVHVDVQAAPGVLRVGVRDDGLRGADPVRGSGLTGLRDRAEAIGGKLSLHSPLAGGTSLVVELPLDPVNEG
jgi:signal transduction histidine kinase